MGNRAVQNQRVQASAQLFSQPVRSTTLLWLGGNCGLLNLRYIRVFRIALAFGLAQAIMPALGWLLFTSAARPAEF